MLKKIMPLFLLCSVSAYAAETAPMITAGIRNNDALKGFLGTHINIWNEARERGKISNGSGLAKVYAAMSANTIVADEQACILANIYLDIYWRLAGEEEAVYNQKHTTIQNNTTLTPAEKYAEHNQRYQTMMAQRRSAYYDIMFERGEAIRLPEDKKGCFSDDGTKGFLEQILRLNDDETKLKSTAVRAFALLSAYHAWNDGEKFKDDLTAYHTYVAAEMAKRKAARLGNHHQIQ